MYKSIVLTVFSGVLALSVREAGAACGGGGWHKSESASKPAAAAAQVSERAEPVAYQSSTASTNRSSAGFDSQFDGVIAQLSLDESQQKDVAKAKENVRNRIAKLEKKLARAEEKLAQCTGDCEDETRDVSKAREARQSYNANAEFEKELKSILTSRQWDLYNSASSSSVK